MAFSHPKGAVSASTPNGPSWETGRVSDGVHTHKRPQCTQRKTDAGGTRQGQPHRRAPNGYHAQQVWRRCLGSGHGQAQRARFSASLHVPRAAAQ